MTTKHRTIIIHAVHSKKLSGFRLFHDERIHPSANVKTSLRGVRLFATAQRSSLGTGGYRGEREQEEKPFRLYRRPQGLRGVTRITANCIICQSKHNAWQSQGIGQNQNKGCYRQTKH
jgi:hypothetical protein